MQSIKNSNIYDEEMNLLMTRKPILIEISDIFNFFSIEFNKVFFEEMSGESLVIISDIVLAAKYK